MRVCWTRAKAGLAAAASIGLASALLARPTHALELELPKAAPCPSDEIAFRVANAIAQPLTSIPGPTFSVGIERIGSGYVGRVDVAGSSNGAALGQRRVTASSCDELVDTLALALVLAIAGERDAAASATAASAPPEDDAFARTTSISKPASDAGDALQGNAASTADSAAGASVAGFAAVVGDAGSLPAFGLGVAGGADLAWPGVELRALGMLLPGAEGSVDRGDPASPGAEIGLVVGGLLVCAPLSTRRLGAELAACVGAELGRVSGHGTRIDTSHSSATWWAAPRVDLTGRWALPLPRLALELGVTAAAPIWRDEFVLEGVGSVHRAAPVVGRGSLSLRAAFGP